MDYSNWSFTDARVTSLLLDPHNPRLPGRHAGATQQQIIAELIEHEDVLGLAKQIADRGFFPTEVLAAVEEDSKLIVVEGNRRLAALKLLNDPNIAPERHRNRCLLLSQRVSKTQISKVRVSVAPNRDAIVPLLLGRHTQEGVRSWSPAMQAQYVTSLEGDLTDEELIETYGLTAQSIAEARLRAALYEMALAVDLPPDVKAKVNDPREFPLTNLERVVEMKEGRQFLGVTLDPKHGVQGVVPKEEFEKGFRKLVADVANGVVTSRTTNKGEEVRRYFETYPDECRPNTNRRGSFLPSDIVGQASPPSASTKPPATPSSRAPRQAKSILGPDVKCTVNDARIQDIFKEIKKLRIVDHPNASALMVRTLLELAVIRYLKKRGEIAAMKAEIQKKQTSNIPRDWHPELRPMLKRLLGDQTLPLDGQERRALRKLAEERDSPVTLDSLNAFVHSPLDTPVERELRAISVKLKPLFAILLNDK